MAELRISPPEAFTFSRPEEWTKWIRRFERFRQASGLAGKEQVSQIHTLIYTMGDSAEDILSSFRLTEEQGKSYTTVVEKFEGHFVKRRNLIFERAKFNRRKQEEGEPVDDFIMDLYRLAEHCSYGNLHDELVRDRIVVGLRSAALSEKLQRDADLTLDKAVRMAREDETIRKQQALLRNDFKEDKPEQGKDKSDLDYLRKKPFKHRGKPPSATPPAQQQNHKKCTRCGRSPPHSREQCPAREETCHKCNKKGHFKSMCRTKGVKAIDAKDSKAFMGVIKQSRTSNPWSITLLVNGTPVNFKIDTGADVTVISDSIHQGIPHSTLQPPTKSLSGAASKNLEVSGQFSASLKYKDKEADEEVYVVKNLSRSLLGHPAIEALDLLQRVNAVQTKTDIERQFLKLFEGLGKLEEEYKIVLRDNAQPYAQSTPRRIAIPLLPRVKAELEHMEQMGVVSRVREPTDWCSSMVVVPKADGSVRICVDLSRLNESVRREHHPLPAVEQALAQLAEAQIFSKIDANSGFWQIPLAKESALLTTFITPFGRFCFNRLPFGITSAPEHFQRRMSEILHDVEGAVCLMDDILVHGKSTEEHDRRLHIVLQRLQDAGVTLNKKKCMFSQDRVKFLGQIVDPTGVRPDPDKVSAIVNYKTPTCVGDIRRLLGMTNQLGKFSPNLANVTKPLRDLLAKDSQWCWDEPQRHAFREVRQEISKSPVLALFDPRRPTTVSADASSFGLGAVLLQQQDDGEKRPVAYASRSMTRTEQRYAQIEKEALAITWACDRFADYLIGLKFHVETDHKPLVPLLGARRLDELPIRVQRFRMRMLRYHFTISHVPGKNLVVADTLSRAPESGESVQDCLEQEVEAYVDATFSSIPATERRMEEIRQHQEEDPVIRQLKVYCRTGWPSTIPGVLKPYRYVSSELTVEKGLLMRGSRVVIPASLRVDMLGRIHSAHQGITKCRERAKHSCWWPGLSRQLEETVKSCPECLKHSPLRPEPLVPSKLPHLPWQKVGTDLFEWNKSDYLLMVDYYSRWIEVSKLKGTTTQEVIKHTSSIFARHGIPEIVVSDNGPQFSAELYATFAKDYGFEHVTSSPYYPQGNGEAERAVKTIKGLLRKSGDPYLSLLAYRSTPLENGYSPAQLLMSRNLRTTLPTTREQRCPKVVNPLDLEERDDRLKDRQKRNFDQRHRAKDLPELQPGDTVWIPDRNSPGTVLEGETPSPRSHNVQTRDGTYRRNRQHLVQIPVREPIQEVGNETEPQDSEQPSRTRSTRSSRPPERYDPSWT